MVRCPGPSVRLPPLHGNGPLAVMYPESQSSRSSVSCLHMPSDLHYMHLHCIVMQASHLSTRLLPGVAHNLVSYCL